MLSLRPLHEIMKPVPVKPVTVSQPGRAPGIQPVNPSKPAVLGGLAKPAILSGLPKPASVQTPPAQAKTVAGVSQLWGLQAAISVLRADKDYDGKLDQAEYQQVALVQGDAFLASRARDYEFAVVDEIKLVDGYVSMGELAEFYRGMDSDHSGSHSTPEFEARLNQSSWITRLRHPVASFTHLISPYANLLKSSLGLS